MLLPGFCPVIFGNCLELRLGERADPTETPERFFQTLACFLQAFIDRQITEDPQRTDRLTGRPIHGVGDCGGFDREHHL